MRKLTERLRDTRSMGQEMLREEAADRIDALEAALRPFAGWSLKLDAHYTTQGYPDDCALVLYPDGINRNAPTVGDLRRARKLFED